MIVSPMPAVAAYPTLLVWYLSSSTVDTLLVLTRPPNSHPRSLIIRFSQSQDPTLSLILSSISPLVPPSSLPALCGGLYLSLPFCLLVYVRDPAVGKSEVQQIGREIRTVGSRESKVGRRRRITSTCYVIRILKMSLVLASSYACNTVGRLLCICAGCCHSSSRYRYC
jgi:hypothetical protein